MCNYLTININFTPPPLRVYKKEVTKVASFLYINT